MKQVIQSMERERVDLMEIRVSDVLSEEENLRNLNLVN